MVSWSIMTSRNWTFRRHIWHFQQLNSSDCPHQRALPISDKSAANFRHRNVTKLSQLAKIFKIQSVNEFTYEIADEDAKRSIKNYKRIPKIHLLKNPQPSAKNPMQIPTKTPSKNSKKRDAWERIPVKESLEHQQSADWLMANYKSN